MRRFAFTHPLPILGILAFAAACTDANAPDPHASLRPGSPTPALQGNLPPPPTRTAIDVTVNSPITLNAVFTGVYFANPSLESAAAANDVGDLTLVNAAWLRLDNKQAAPNSVSANARFQLTDQKSSGNGTLYIFSPVDGLTHKVVIGAVTWLTANPKCDAAFDLCAVITFDATVDGQTGHSGRVAAVGCEIVEGEGGPYLYCPFND